MPPTIFAWGSGVGVTAIRAAAAFKDSRGPPETCASLVSDRADGGPAGEHADSVIKPAASSEAVRKFFTYFGGAAATTPAAWLGSQSFDGAQSGFRVKLVEPALAASSGVAPCANAPNVATNAFPTSVRLT